MTPTENYKDAPDYRCNLPPPVSLLSVRRPSLAGLSQDSLSPARTASRISPVAGSTQETFSPTSSRYLLDTEQDDANMPDVTQGLEIKMQDWVEGGVGKMSISPSGRDVVLAARSGLYVIDLEMPLELPRFVPQGGTWDVADVQWNPHPSRGNLVVSTSSEKLLIWNLDRTDRSAIQLILSKHYRSITDVNWHNHHPDIVASTGIDSWIWVWDLRTTVKPVAGLCAFNPGATQVKWNRHSENILASSHSNTLLIWDQRKGAVPLGVVKAHSSRIYGIDWSRTSRNEIVTCSLDCTIKFWDTGVGWCNPSSHAPPVNSHCIPSPMHPERVIRMNYPVWRSRYTPFGNGVLSLPQRGFQRPELLRFVDAEQDETAYKSIFPIPEGAPGEGIVKEYVWRVKGGFDSLFDDREFQLVTWNEDKTIRAWPINSTTLEDAGFSRGAPINNTSHRPLTKYISYRNISEQSSSKPRDPSVLNRSGVHAASRANATRYDPEADTTPNTSPSKTVWKPGAGTATIKRGGTMTKGPCKFKSKRSSGMHALAWMPSVKTVGRGRETRGESRGGELSQSPYESLESSMASLDSFEFGGRDTSGDKDNFNIQNINQSQSTDDRVSDFDSESAPSWAEELTSVVNGLTATKTAKISLEKVWLRKRMCRVGLQGPWGESSSIFIRVTFAFPKDYPRSVIPPQIDLEKNHLMPVKRRAMLLRGLRSLGKKPPCIEPCLRLLLGLPIEKGGVLRKAADLDSSSDESARAVSSRGKDSVILGQGLAEPRTSQGIFSPNGQLVIFSHKPVRMVKNVSRNISLSPSASSHIATGRRTLRANLDQESSGFSDALRRLTAAAQDRRNAPIAVGMDDDLLRALELLSHSKPHHDSRMTTASGPRAGYLVRPIRKSLVSIRDLADVTGLDQFIARSYVVSGANPTSFCLQNADIAKSLNRADHERVFRTLGSLLETKFSADSLSSQRYRGWQQDHLCRSTVFRFLNELTEKKDVLMLAMVSVALLISDSVCMPPKSNIIRQFTHVSLSTDKSNPFKSMERYRIRAPSTASTTTQPSPGRPQPFPSTSAISNSLTSHTSSRSAWMGIANGVRYLVGSQDGQSTPKAQGSPIERSKTLPIIQDGNVALSRSSDSKQSSLGDSLPKQSPRFTVSFSPSHQEKGPSRNHTFEKIALKKRLITQISLIDNKEPGNRYVERQLSTYVLAFAEVLFRWGLKQKRSELLCCLPKAAARFVGSVDMGSESLSINDLCHLCSSGLDRHVNNQCGRGCQPKPLCTVCRLPVKGLSNVCLICRHITHLSCWGPRKQPTCPLGCGCECNGREEFEPTDSQPSRKSFHV